MNAFFLLSGETVETPDEAGVHLVCVEAVSLPERASTWTENLLTINGLTKAYPGVVANDNVSFEIGVGEVHALLGENGAGKSTLVKMIYGLVKPDSGTMILRGAPFAPQEPRVARAAGVAMVFPAFFLFLMR